jgi:hypothetical protein
MEPETDQRPWYKKKRYVILAALLGLFLAFGGDSPESVPATSIITPAVEQAVSISADTDTQAAAASQATDKAATPQLSNDNYYTNVDGNQVHSPAHSLNGDVPPGATARCRDGTYSFSQNRRGTCSHHGGVASWL